MRGISAHEANKRAERRFHRFGIGPLSPRRKAQGTGLARAFALEPEILLRAEPFTALDQSTKNPGGGTGGILSETALSTVFVTHDYTEIPHLAELVAVLFSGRVVRSGSTKEIFGEDFILNPWHTF